MADQTPDEQLAEKQPGMLLAWKHMQIALNFRLPQTLKHAQRIVKGKRRLR